MKIKGFSFFLVTIVVLILYWSISGNGDYPRPTEDYYVNDYAEVLMQATRRTITNEGDRLFAYTEDEIEGGAQIVFATFRVDNLSDIADYDKTEIFRQWRIGKNDMGLLVLLFFMEDDTNGLELVESQIETGYRMEQYLTPAKLGRILDETLYNEEFSYLIDMGVANLLYELLTEVYVGIYGYESFDYDMDAYYDYLMSYVPDTDSEPSAMGLLVYLLSPYSSFWDKFITALPLIFIVIYGGGLGIISKAGGGSSGGMGVFRRRR